MRKHDWEEASDQLSFISAQSKHLHGVNRTIAGNTLIAQH